MNDRNDDIEAIAGLIWLVSCGANVKLGDNVPKTHDGELVFCPFNHILNYYVNVSFDTKMLINVDCEKMDEFIKKVNQLLREV